MKYITRDTKIHIPTLKSNKFTIGRATHKYTSHSHKHNTQHGRETVKQNNYSQLDLHLQLCFSGNFLRP